MVEREITSHLKSLARQYPVVTITGPRQSGKTTLARQTFADKAYINLEMPDNREFATADPRGFLRKIPDGAILDEIQRAPELASYIQGVVDEKRRNGMFILTGSQQFEVTNSVNQSLAGRTALLKLLPFSMTEVANNYDNSDIDQLLYTGFYPRIYDQGLNPTQTLADYFETYVERDLRQLIQVKNLHLFQKFVRICAGRVAQILNLQSLGNDVGISHTTAREWLTILEASYVIFLLEPFSANVSKRLVKSPKLYFCDVGLASYLIGAESVKHLEVHPLRGNLFENMVLIEVLKYRYNRGQRNNLNFYRDSRGNEVDLLYSVGPYVYPMEIKAAETFSTDFLKGLKSLQKAIPEMPFGKAVIYAGDRDETRGDVQITNMFTIPEMLNGIK